MNLRRLKILIMEQSPPTQKIDLKLQHFGK